jgi:Nucleoside-diphosphate-sugar pyrophosphorylase involved in lipopolysaccharide biosynthesis/translation initiation factor 2B, gamma/epsilon subunits (eIF-2Bgamma/eIF-2Bepsilon)
MPAHSSPGRVVILAGGVGRRLAPYTFVIPKPIVPIGTTPILEVVLRQLCHYGFRDITIALGHMSEIIRAVAGDGSRFGVNIAYSQETQPMGTIGPLTLIPDLSDDFVVMNADLLTDLDFGDLWARHRAHGGIATVATFEKTTKLELGVLRTAEDDRIVAFEEKPTLRHKVSMGIYVFNRSVFRYIPSGKAFGFDALMADLLKAGEAVRSYAFHGRWLDIGVPADYDRAQQEFEEHRSRYLPSAEAPAQ